MQAWAEWTRRRAAPASFGLILTGAFVLFVWTGFNSELGHDEAVFVYASTVVADGNLPYVEAFENTGPIGPAIGGLFALVGRWFDVSDLTAVRAGYVLVALGAVGVVYGATRSALGGWVSPTIASLALMSFNSFTKEASNGPRPKTIVVAFGMAAVWAAQRRRWRVAGALAALAGLAWQPGATVLLVVLVGAWGDPHRRTAVVRTLGGFLAPIGGLVAIYAAGGHLRDLADGLVVFNARYTERFDPGLVDRILLPLKNIWGAHPIGWPILVGGSAAMLWIALRGARRNPTVWLYGTAFLVVVAWTVFDYQGTVDLHPFLPLAALGIAWLPVALARRWRVWALPTTSALLITILATVAAAESIRGANDSLGTLTAVVERETSPTDSFASLSVPTALVARGGSNPVRYYFSINGLSDFVADREGWRAIIGELEAARVNVIAIGPRLLDEYPSMTPFVRWLRAHYTFDRDAKLPLWRRE